MSGRPRGPEPLSEIIVFRVTDEELADIDAQRGSMTRSAYLRMALADALERTPQEMLSSRWLSA